MTRRNNTAKYNKLLLHFMGEADPLYSMLQWLKERMMEVEAGSKAGWGHSTCWFRSSVMVAIFLFL